MKDSHDSTSSAILSSIRINKPPLMEPIWGLIAFEVIVVLPVAVVCSIYNLSAFSVGIGIGLLMIPFSMVAKRFVRKRIRARIDRIFTDEIDPRDRLRAVSKLEPYSSVNILPISLMTQIMAEKGQIGDTYQLWWRAEPAPVDPLTMMFEPRLLDEADPAFDELDQAVASDEQPSEPNTSAPSTMHRDELLDMRRFKRNMKFIGGWPGWIILVGMVIYILGAGLQSLQLQMITWKFLIGITCLMLFLFAPRRTSWFTTNQWLLVPSGILHRKAKARDKKVTLHLFDRRRSVLTIYQQRRGPWLLSVADAEAAESTIITDRERNLLLRTWLSPQDPPPVERLSDWA